MEKISHSVICVHIGEKAGVRFALSGHIDVCRRLGLLPSRAVGLLYVVGRTLTIAICWSGQLQDDECIEAACCSLTTRIGHHDLVVAWLLIGREGSAVATWLATNLGVSH